MFIAEKRHKTYYVRNEVNGKWILDVVERETAVVTQRVRDAENAVMQDLTTADNRHMTSGMPEPTFEVMLYAIGDSLSDLVCADEDQNGEDMDDDANDTMLGKLSEDDELGWVICTISKIV
jgi:hypothetical protein